MQDYNYVSYRSPESNVIQGMTDNGIELKPKGARAGDADRDRAMDHVNQMRKLGYLKEHDADARLTYLETAEVKEQVALAIQDLPPLPAPKQKFSLKDYDFSKRRWYVPTLLPIVLLGLIMIAAPLGLTDWHVHWQAGLAASLIVTGVLTFISSVVALCVKLDNQKDLYCRNMCA